MKNNQNKNKTKWENIENLSWKPSFYFNRNSFEDRRFPCGYRGVWKYCIVLLFYYHFAIHTKYAYKIVKKNEAREAKEANKACV